ncbi:MAG: CehA/McbA family metallohydrolase, partial [Planctomycetota bacterium]
PDIELSSDEEGAQIGSDLANTLCLGQTRANHMGAHDITQRLEGGDDGFLGFCDGFFGDVLDDFTDTITAVRAQGGFPIAHHPTAGSYAWNSFNATQGLEASGLQGVEIWNGDDNPGQGGDVGRWVDWLLAGRILYAFGGSDTHDQAFDFGANHALLLGEAFSSDSVMNALRRGRNFISNGPSLILEIERGGVVHLMGDRVTLPTGGPAQMAEIRAHVEFESGMTGSVTLFTGEVGAAGETTLDVSPISGSGVSTVQSTVGGGTSRTWVRAFAVSADGMSAAYSNPIFFDPSGPLVFDSYCAADGTGCTACPCGNDAPAGTQGGCLNAEGRSAQILASGLPSLANDTLRLEVRSAGSTTFALLTSGDRRLPSNPMNPCFYAGSGILSPVLDGLRCIGGNFQRHGARPTDANGDVGVTTPGWGAPDGPASGLAAQGAFVSGQTRQFQAFYRDLLTPPACGLGQNTTDAVSVLFLP